MIGKLFKMIALVAVMGIAGLGYYMYQHQLNPLDSNDLKKALSSTKSRFDNIEDAVKAAGSKGPKTVIYKRKDANDNWYYTNEPPKEGEQSEKLIYRSDTNVIPKLPGEGEKPE